MYTAENVCIAVKSSSPTGEAVVVDETETEVKEGSVKEAQLVVIDTDETTPAKTSSPSPSEPKPSSQKGSPEPSSVAGEGAASPLTTSITTGSAHTLEGSTQIYENRAYDEGISISESEQATDVSSSQIFLLQFMLHFVYC